MKTIRCAYCGRFISFEDFLQDKAGWSVTPDTHFTKEEIFHFHVECVSE